MLLRPKIPNVPMSARDTVYHPLEHLASDPPTKPLLDVPCGDTYVLTDTTPNAASDQPRELPNGVVWC
jgi:hypothetical protein